MSGHAVAGADVVVVGRGWQDELLLATAVRNRACAPAWRIGIKIVSRATPSRRSGPPVRSTREASPCGLAPTWSLGRGGATGSPTAVGNGASADGFDRRTSRRARTVRSATRGRGERVTGCRTLLALGDTVRFVAELKDANGHGAAFCGSCPAVVAGDSGLTAWGRNGRDGPPQSRDRSVEQRSGRRTDTLFARRSYDGAKGRLDRPEAGGGARCGTAMDGGIRRRCSGGFDGSGCRMCGDRRDVPIPWPRAKQRLVARRTTRTWEARGSLDWRSGRR